MNRIDDLLAEEGAAAERPPTPESLPEHVSVSRPNLSRPTLGRPTVVSVRLSAEEHRQLQSAAKDAGLPVSTLIRLWAMDRLRAERESAEGSIAERLARLEREVFGRPAEVDAARPS